jgi:hypothetical protein
MLKGKTPSYEGLVRKRGQLNDTFRERYFVLSEGVVSNYKSKKAFEGGNAAQSSMICHGMKVVNVSHGDDKTGFEFTLVDADGRQVTCSVSSKTERNIWIEKLSQAAASVANESNLSVDDNEDEDADAEVESFASDDDEYDPLDDIQVKVPAVSGQSISMQNQRAVQDWLNRKPERNPIYRFMGISRAEQKHMGASRVIHPLSHLNLSVQMLSCVLVIYTGIETPAVLAFKTLEDCEWPVTNTIDLMIEVFFAFEIGLQFFTGAFDAQGTYVENLRQLASMYIRRTFFESFAFDFLTALPFTWLELVLYAAECSQPDSHPSKWAQQIKVPIRILRPFRLLKVLHFPSLHPPFS